MNQNWAIGVDLGGTKVEAALVNLQGRVEKRIRRSTDVKDGPKAVEDEIVSAVQELENDLDSPLLGVGIGVAGQVDPKSGMVIFAPNLDWHNVEFRANLEARLDCPVAVVNDVRAATWGEWLYGAGQGIDDLICIFVGTGIGGGVIFDGRMLTGCSNTAGEIGHIVIEIDGPICHCGNHGCLEALAGGWAIGKQAREAITKDPIHGAELLRMAGGVLEDVSAKTVAQATHAGNPMATEIIEQATHALVQGVTSLVNSFNPCLVILGGGVIEGLPELQERIAQGVREKTLKSASQDLKIRLAQLHNDSGVIGAAAIAADYYRRKVADQHE